MAKLATFVIGTLAGGLLGIVGVVAAMGALSPSADHVASVSEQSVTSGEAIYGKR